jgi:predicted O-methyltransferase YrrM
MRPELSGLQEPQWFHHAVQILDLLDLHKPKRCVELGTYKGGSAIPTARAIIKWHRRDECEVFCVDKWDGDITIGQCARYVLDAGVSDIVWLEGTTTVEAARWWKEMHRPMIDYLYVDAGHTYDQVKTDLELWWPFLKVGGLIAGDDYDDPHGIPEQGVTAAWDVFERVHNQQFNRTTSPELLGCQCDRCKMGRLVWGVKR